MIDQPVMTAASYETALVEATLQLILASGLFSLCFLQIIE